MNPSEFTLEKAFTPLFDGRALSHAYIVSGADTELAEALARTLAAAYVCAGGAAAAPCMACGDCAKARRGIHPDVISVGPAPGSASILIEQAREIRENAFVMPNEASRKVYVISRADTMNLGAQNALLKVLEEPPPSCAFILIAQNPRALLETVRSRCVTLGLGAGAEPAGDWDELAESFFGAVSDGGLELVEFTFALDRLDREALDGFLRSARAAAVRRLRAEMESNGTGRDRLEQTLGILDTARKYYDYNVGAGHIAGLLCAGLMK